MRPQKKRTWETGPSCHAEVTAKAPTVEAAEHSKAIHALPFLGFFTAALLTTRTTTGVTERLSSTSWKTSGRLALGSGRLPSPPFLRDPRLPQKHTKAHFVQATCGDFRVHGAHSWVAFDLIHKKHLNWDLRRVHCPNQQSLRNTCGRSM